VCVAAAASDYGDRHEIASHIGAAEQIDDGGSDTGGVDGEGAALQELGMRDDGFHPLDDFGVRGSEPDAFDGANHEAGGAFFIPAGVEPFISPEGFEELFDDGQGGIVAALSEVESDVEAACVRVFQWHGCLFFLWFVADGLVDRFHGVLPDGVGIAIGHQFQRFDIGFKQAFTIRVCEEETAILDKLTFVFLGEVLFTDQAFFIEKLGGNAGALRGRDGEPVPIGGGGGELVVEEAALAKGSGDKDDISAADGEGWAEGVIERIGHAGRFIDDEERGVGEAADVGVDGRESDDTGSVGGEADAVAGDLIGDEPDAGCVAERENFGEGFGGLTFARREDDAEGSGLKDGTMGKDDGRDRGLAKLAVAVERDAAAERSEDTRLGGIGLEIERIARKGGDTHTLRKEVGVGLAGERKPLTSHDVDLFLFLSGGGVARGICCGCASWFALLSAALAGWAVEMESAAITGVAFAPVVDVALVIGFDLMN
jgi:hypothetical protein